MAGSITAVALTTITVSASSISSRGYLRSDRERCITDENGKKHKDGNYDKAVESTIIAVIRKHLQRDDQGNQAVTQTLEDDQLWCACSLDLHGAHIHETFDLSGATIQTSMNCDNVQFHGRARFRNCIIQHGSFIGATITGTWFIGATITGTRFDAATSQTHGSTAPPSQTHSSTAPPSQTHSSTTHHHRHMVHRRHHHRHMVRRRHHHRHMVRRRHHHRHTVHRRHHHRHTVHRRHHHRHMAHRRHHHRHTVHRRHHHRHTVHRRHHHRHTVRRRHHHRHTVRRRTITDTQFGGATITDTRFGGATITGTWFAGIRDQGGITFKRAKFQSKDNDFGPIKLESNGLPEAQNGISSLERVPGKSITFAATSAPTTTGRCKDTASSRRMALRPRSKPGFGVRAKARPRHRKNDSRARVGLTHHMRRFIDPAGCAGGRSVRVGAYDRIARPRPRHGIRTGGFAPVRIPCGEAQAS